MALPVFFTAPHRVMFLAAAVQALAAMAFWSVELGGRAGLWAAPHWPLLDRMPPFVLHAMLLSCGVFPLFVFGFILTAGPRWQGAAELGRRDFLPAFGLLAAGWLLVWLSLPAPVLLPLGLALALGGWAAAARTLTRIARHRAHEREHVVIIAGAAWLGAAGLGGFAAFAGGAPLAWARLGMALALWGFLLPVFSAVAHRMLPFFTSTALPGYRVRRPAWALRLLVAASLGHGALAFLELPAWLWLADLPATLAAGRLSWLWWSRAVLGNRMVAVLHLAFAWVAPAFALSALQSLLWPLAPGLLGQAPLHALTLGFFGSMAIGMVSRVALGHSGRPVTADAAMWRAFCLMQGAAVLRVAGDLPALPGAGTVVWLSSLLWLAAFGLWAGRYVPTLWRPRADGRPG